MGGPLSLVYPVLAQVLLTLVLMLWMGLARLAAIKARRVRFKDIALSAEPWPDEVRKISNNAHNQFETPVLFYVLCGIATYIGPPGILMTLLAWAYVATRLVHTAIHTTSNRVEHRFKVFAVGLAILAVMWVVLAAQLLAHAPDV
jgi:hypothetical protein